jgi:hypothetical protein
MGRIILPLILMLALSSGGRAPAQGQTNSTGLTGSWNVTLYGPDGNGVAIVLLTCHPDGTGTGILPGFGDSPGAGAWASTGNGQFAMTTLHFDLNPPPDKNPVNGLLKVRYSVSVSGTTMSGSAEFVQLDITGAKVVKDLTGVTLTGVPITVEQIGAP